MKLAAIVGKIRAWMRRWDRGAIENLRRRETDLLRFADLAEKYVVMMCDWTLKQIGFDEWTWDISQPYATYPYRLLGKIARFHARVLHLRRTTACLVW